MPGSDLLIGATKWITHSRACADHYRRSGVADARRSVEKLEEVFEDIRSHIALRPRAAWLPELRNLHRDLPCGALLRLLAARDRPAALDRESRRHLRRDAGEDLVLRPVLHLRRALPLREFAWRPCHDHARGRDQARHAVGQGRAAPVLRVMLKLISTGNQLAPDMINARPLRRLGTERHEGRGAAQASCAKPFRCRP